MTFEDFQQICNQAVTTNLPVQQPCPIIIGEGNDRAYLGDTPNHHLIIFRTVTNSAALRSLYNTVRFTFDAPNNQTVIQPLTTGT
jgi:hypothetical protein